MNAAVRSLKGRVPSALKNTSLYARLKNSYVHDLYWKVGKRQLIDLRTRQVEFYRDLLEGFQASDLIFDIGANVGEKTDAFIRLGARVVAVEPDEHNQEVLREGSSNTDYAQGQSALSARRLATGSPLRCCG